MKSLISAQSFVTWEIDQTIQTAAYLLTPREKERTAAIIESLIEDSPDQPERMLPAQFALMNP